MRSRSTSRREAARIPRRPSHSFRWTASLCTIDRHGMIHLAFLGHALGSVVMCWGAGILVLALWLPSALASLAFNAGLQKLTGQPRMVRGVVRWDAKGGRQTRGLRQRRCSWSWVRFRSRRRNGRGAARGPPSLQPGGRRLRYTGVPAMDFRGPTPDRRGSRNSSTSVSVPCRSLQRGCRLPLSMLKPARLWESQQPEKGGLLP
ncbi:MAG: hypothetical protein DIJKHBIC_04175 [Thermoanaerobaculia bacterium]|nr:hypothetical protein [Thermoanaerobaculia bacterium]